MTYLRLLRLLRRASDWAADRTGWWTFTDWSGRIAFRQIDYVRRVQKASGWEPVDATGRDLWHWFTNPPTVTTTTPGATVSYTYKDR